MGRQESIVYCPVCGHSYGNGAVLSIGSDDCGRTLQILTEREWLSIAKRRRLRLTDAGKRAVIYYRQALSGSEKE